MDAIFSSFNTAEMTTYLSSYMVPILLVLAATVLICVSRWRIFKKLGLPGIKGIIPIYGDYTLFKNRWNRKPFWILTGSAVVYYAVSILTSYLMMNQLSGGFFYGTVEELKALMMPYIVISGVTAIIYLIIFFAITIGLNIRVAELFDEGVGFAVGMTVLPFVFYPLLAFAKKRETRRKRPLQIVSTALTLALVFSIVTSAPFAASAAETDDLVVTATEPEELFGEPIEGAYTLEDGLNYQLSDDILLEGYLYVPLGASVSVDLNGHTLSRNLEEVSSTGYILLNDGTLTISDGGTSGKITGGKSTSGGAIYNTGTLTIEDGSITGNYSNGDGGAIYNTGTLTISGGDISANTAKNSAGAIRVNGGMVTISGGTISYNTAENYHGGAIYASECTMDITGGMILNNRAKGEGGAILNGTNSTLGMTGGSVTNNASGNGGGIFVRSDSTLNMSGAPVVTGNTAATPNLYLSTTDTKINVTGKFFVGAQIDVSGVVSSNNGDKRVVTNGFTACGNGAAHAQFFTFGGGANAVVEDGELKAETNSTDASRLTTAQSSGFYKFATTAEGHIASVTAVTASDLTTLIGNSTYAPYNADGYLPLSGGTITGQLNIAGGTMLRFLDANNTERIIGHYTSKGDLSWYNGTAWAKVWHERNMGSGSGLDADLLDGYHASGIWDKPVLSIVSTSSTAKYYKIEGMWGDSYSQKAYLINTRAGEAYFCICGKDDSAISAPYIVRLNNKYSKITGFRHSSGVLYIGFTTYSNGAYIRQIGGTINTLTVTEVTETEYNNATAVSFKIAATTSDNVASATKLATARTIWGQSFDGSANISGALTGVTTISASGQITSTVTTGTAPLSVASTTMVTNLNAEYLGGVKKDGLFTLLENDNEQLSATIGTTNKKLTIDYAAKALRMKQESLNSQEFTYRKSPKTIYTDSVKFDRIKGKTLVWNQLQKYSRKFSSGTINCNYCNVSYSNGIATITGSASSSNQSFLMAGQSATPFVIGHKYLALITYTSTRSVQVYWSGSSGSFGSIPAKDTKYTYKTVATNNYAAGYVGFGFYVNAPESNWETKLYSLSSIDMTLLYGSEIDGLTNAQILAKFEKDYPNAYYDYNAGQLINNSAKAIESVGFNLWDEEWEVGTYNSAGSRADAATAIRTKNKISVFPSTTYYFCSLSTSLGTNSSRLCYYDINGNFIGQRWQVRNDTFTTPSNCAFIAIGFDSSYGATYNNDICINLSDPAKNGQYEPYKRNVLDLHLDAIQVKSPNIWDEEWENGYWSYTIGGQASFSWNSAYISSKNVIPVEPNTTYYITKPNVTTRLLYLDKNGIVVDKWGDSSSITSFTTPANCFGLLFSLWSTATYANNVTINKSDTAFNGRYFKHGILTFNGLKSAGSVYDEITNNGRTLIRRVGTDNLGNKTWGTADSVGISYVSGNASSYANQTHNITAEGYLDSGCASYSQFSSSGANRTVYVSNDNSSTRTLYIRNSDFISKTGTQIKELLSGVLLNYELANYETYEIVEPIPMSLPSGTTERRLPEDTADSVIAPFVADMTYGVNNGDILTDVAHNRAIINLYVDKFVSGDKLLSNGIEVVNLSDTQALTNKTYNGLTLTKQTTGFTIAGGTTSKTLTVNESYTLGAACAKDYTDSSSASAISTGTNLVTERDVYYGLPTINGAHNYTSSTTIYAPTGAGTSGQILKSTAGTPEWINQSAITAGDSDKVDGHHYSELVTSVGIDATNGKLTWAKGGTAETAPDIVAAKLTTVSKTAWGQTFWTSGGIPASISGNMTNVGDITPSANDSKNIGSSSLQFTYIYGKTLATSSTNGLSYCASNGKHRWYANLSPDASYKQMELDANSNLTVQGDVQGMAGVAAYGIADLSIGGGGAGGTVTSITAGTGLSGGTITNSGTIALNVASSNVLGGVKVGSGLSITSAGVLSATVTADTIAGWGYKKGMVYTTSTASDSNIQVATGADPTYQYITNTSQSTLILVVTTSNAATNSYGVHRYIMIYNNRNSATLVQFADQGQGVVGPADNISIPANSYMEFRIIHPASNAKTMVTWSAALKDISTL